MLPNISNANLLHLPLQIPGAVVSCTGKKVLTDLLLTKVLFMIAYPSIFVVGTVGNLLVVWVVVNCKKMQTVTNVFIANLAVSDLLVCFSSIWLTPSYTYIGHWIWGGWLCYSLPLFQGASIFISSLSLTAIALDRYWVICLAPPNRSATQMHTSKQVCIAVIVLIWCVSILLALPYAVHMRIAQVQWPCHFSLCVEDWVDLEDLRSVYGVITAILQFVLPFAIIGRSYRLIWRFIESRRAQLLRPISEAQMNRKQRLLRMLVRMVLVFGCCWLPFNILNLLRDLRMDGWLKPYFSFLFLLSHLLSMVVPAANPLLYAWMNSAFRESFLRALPLGGRLRKKLEMMEIGTVGTGQICGGTSSEGRGGREEFQTDNSQQQQLISNRNSREFRTPQRIPSTISLRYSPNLSNSHN
uniref:G-protein coupled receptors family 1 profile domain-containing protein n=2 Tax=Meloidogyne incognita TaxID=6306 RepID=A0A914LUV4_MELIC